MARMKKKEPIITFTEILSKAGQHIRAEIIKLRQEETELRKGLEEVGRYNEANRVSQMTDRQVALPLEQLKAIETMYRFETGTELGLLADLEYSEEAE